MLQRKPRRSAQSPAPQTQPAADSEHGAAQLQPPPLQLKVQAPIQMEDGVVNMEPLTIHGGRPGNLDRLSGFNRDTSGMSVSPDEERVRQSSVEATTPLPFSGGGWDGEAIARQLGQYDRIPGTDSDAMRCVQTVALVSHILNGIPATNSYLSSIKLQGLLAGEMTDRKRTSLNVIDYTRSQIESQHATFGDLYWVIEAIHAMFYRDDRGTPLGEIHDQVTPIIDFSSNMTRMNVWCGSATEIMTQAAGLANGEQFLLNTWRVSFNTIFDSLEGYEDANRVTYNREDEDTGRVTSHTVRRYRFRAGVKPPHGDIDRNRDTMSGHQMLIYKDATSGEIKMYEPELSEGGRHLYNLSQDSSVLDGLFTDQPDFEIFEYVQILGKMTPMSFGMAQP
ncbi:MAG: hypothetical protein IPJ00_10780 [Saprospirales bacterium]|nr:hypothetical protein [Saprospirales bacterium]